MARAPLWFKIVSVLALLWNLIGIFAFISDVLMGPGDVARLSATQQAMRAAQPAWATAASGVATIGGAIGSIGLLLGKRWAIFALGASLAGLVVQDAGMLTLPGGLGGIGVVPVLLQGLVLLIAIYLVALARKGIAKGWLV
ncbi:MAG: hypothetical protein ABIP38_06205 [Steroidobacteraceae bacterium]